MPGTPFELAGRRDIVVWGTGVVPPSPVELSSGVVTLTSSRCHYTPGVIYGDGEEPPRHIKKVKVERSHLRAGASRAHTSSRNARRAHLYWCLSGLQEAFMGDPLLLVVVGAEERHGEIPAAKRRTMIACSGVFYRTTAPGALDLRAHQE